MSTLLKKAFICNANKLSSGVYGNSNSFIFEVSKGVVGLPKEGQDTDSNLTLEELQKYGRVGIYATDDGEVELKAAEGPTQINQP